MYYLILSLLILDAVLLATVVLLQAGQGGGLASLGGATTDSVLGSRQSVTLLTRMSWWCGGAFLVLSLLLSLMSSGTQTGTSDLQQRLRTSSPPASTRPSPLPITPAPGAAPGTAAPATTAPTTTAPASGAAKTPPAPAPKTRPAQ
jgi:preprotein translocase subunit SecG